MPEQRKQQSGKQLKDKSDKENKNVDLNELAKKIVALLLRELDIERERLGR